MCLILLKPAGMRLPRMLFKNVFEKNKDGFGFMYYDTEQQKIVWEKIVTDNWEAHYDLYLPHEAHEICLHWRYGTHGTKDFENAHPHVVKDGELMLMHNGVISGYGGYNVKDSASDTVEFLDKTLRPICDENLDTASIVANKGFRHLLGKAVGDSNKLMLLTRQGFTMINQFFITADTYIPEMRGLLFSNNYAWNNEYWYETAYQNEINEEYVNKVAPHVQHTNLTHYSSKYSRYTDTPYGNYGGTYHGTTVGQEDQSEEKEDTKEAASDQKEQNRDASTGRYAESTTSPLKARIRAKVINLNGKYSKKNMRQALPQSIITPEKKEVPVLLNNPQAIRNIVDGVVDLVEIGESGGVPIMAAVMDSDKKDKILVKEHSTVQ